MLNQSLNRCVAQVIQRDQLIQLSLIQHSVAHVPVDAGSKGLGAPERVREQFSLTMVGNTFLTSAMSAQSIDQGTQIGRTLSTLQQTKPLEVEAARTSHPAAQQVAIPVPKDVCMQREVTGCAIAICSGLTPKPDPVETCAVTAPGSIQRGCMTPVTLTQTMTVTLSLMQAVSQKVSQHQ